MRNRLIKKYSVMLVMGVYALSTFLQSFSFLNFNKVYAQESQLDYINLVAVLVDDKIYLPLEDDIKRYAQKYIQGSDSNTRYNAISNSKAIVLPIDVENISAVDITKILENMYFDGISREPSKLVGVILFGDIPLPVVNQNGFVYPTIYPYVDFEEQKFIWNEELRYFAYNDKPKGQAEIWHGLINFDTLNEYKNYFEKLKDYSQNPGDFIGKNIWHDDIIANKKYFYQEALLSYVNNILFAEDIGYRRYNDLMIKLMQGGHNDMISELLQGFGGAEQLMSTMDEMSTPTMTIPKMVKDGYLKSYSSLIGGRHLDNVFKNIETANRWVENYTGSDGSGNTRTSLDTHYLKIEQKDETLLRMEGGLDPLIITFNNALENILDEKIEEEKYWLNEVIPLTYLKYEGYEKITPTGKSCTRKEYSAYENHFFGMSAKYISNMQQTSTYRGTFRNFDNISGVTIDDIQGSNIPSLDLDNIDLNKKSIGGSYDIFATQVDANRGYNIMNTIQELEIYSGSKIAQREYWNTKCDKVFLGICWRKRRRESDTSPVEHLCNPNDEDEQAGCELPQEFALRNWGGASPLNLSGMNAWLSGYRFQDAIMPIFNIAGSKALKQAEVEANSFEGINKFTRLIQKTFVPTQKKYYTKNKNKENPASFGLGYNSSMGEDMKFTNRLPTVNMDNPTWIYTNPLQIGSVNFFDKFDSSAIREAGIIKISKQQAGDCLGKGEIYTYKTLDSRVKNNLSTDKEINGTSYKIFYDDISPSKIFYESLIDKLDRLDDDVQNVINDLSIISTGGVRYSLNELKNYIDGIENDISNINNFGLSTLSNMNTNQIQDLANQWNLAFTQQHYISLLEQSEEIKNQLLALEGFVDSFGYDYLDEYTKEQFYNFKINDRKLIFLDSWKTSLFTKMVNTKNKFNSIKPLVINAKNEYDDIERIPITLSALLLAKKNAINAHIQNSSGVSLGCSSTYVSLCNAINTVRNNLDDYRSDLNDEIDEITVFDFQNFDLEGFNIGSIINGFNPFGSIQSKIPNPDMSNSYTSFYQRLQFIPSSNNTGLTSKIPGMNLTTSDRPTDSPRYITFKGIGGDKVTFIYPNLYKAEVFSGNSDVLKLKSPKDIENAIKDYLKETVTKYNEYLSEQNQKKITFYNQNNQAYNKLNQGDPLANPISSGTNRPYTLIAVDYLIKELEAKLQDSAFFTGNMGGYSPIEFISHIIYYQNIGWPQRKVGGTIQEDISNIVKDFDVNEKISHIMDNYLVSDNNLGAFITPGYRDDGYEVAYINSDGNDYINYKAEPIFIQNIKSAASSFQQQSIPQITKTNMEEELINECNIPEAEGVLLFDLSDGTSPWANALKCRWDKIVQKPFEFSFDWSSSMGPVFSLGQEGDSVENVISSNLGWDSVQSQYMNQLGYLDNDSANQEILDNSNPGDYQKLEKILSYTKIQTINPSINADNANGTISISSSIQLGDVKFYIKNVGESLISLGEGNTWIAGHITEGKNGYVTGSLTFDPMNTKELNFKIDEPIAGSNVIVFYMCLPATQNIENCVKNSLKLNVIPGQIQNIEIETPGNIILQGSKMPINVIGTDQFGNNVGQLLTEKFDISVSSGSISYQNNTNNKISFSDFNKSNFIINANDVNDGDQIRIDVDGWIGGQKGTYASKIILVRKGEIGVYQNDNLINDININLPSSNEYSYKDSFDLTQVNLNTIPKIKIKLKDSSGNNINIESLINVVSKNSLLIPGEIEERYVTKVQNNMSFDVLQRRFSQKNNHIIKSGELIVYFMPSFKAGEDIISISMPGIETINIPVNVNPGPASIVEINVKQDSISKNSNTNASLKISDNRKNIVKGATAIKLGIIGPISISGWNSTSAIITVSGGSMNFDISSLDKGGAGFVYATIEGLLLNEQKPGHGSIIVQEKLLPEKDLNVMYLNLFGSDWGNQRGFMSDNNKYVEMLISNSDKLLAATTQLINPNNIKKFPVIISDDLKILNTNDDIVWMELDSQMYIKINDIGKFKIESNNLDIQTVNVSDENIENVIQSLIDSKYSNKNLLIYIPEDTDSIIESNVVKNKSILINNQNIFDLNNKKQDTNLQIKLKDNNLLGYQIWEMSMGNKKIGQLLYVVNNKTTITISPVLENLKYDHDKIWIDGSTNRQGWGFYEVDSKLPKNSMGYNSIQNSDDPTLGIGFTADFKNISNFAAGQPVGQASLNFASEFLINIGDPLLKRIDDNISAKMLDTDLNIEIDSGFDKGIGEVIYSEPGKTIFKVKNVDFNNDGLEDIIVAFTDGTIKILKNYGGNNPFKQLGDLMILAGGIKDIIVGDVSGNGYPDIIIWNKFDQLRVYKNDVGVFDVDGYPICINTNVKDGLISDDPQYIGGINQIFFEDMDDDGKLDIITNDKLGFIKIFYGGKTNGKENYVSSDKNFCDDNRHQRQSANNNTKMVYRFGISIDENIKVVDQSMVRWKGINPNNNINVSAQDMGINTQMFDSSNLDIDNMDAVLLEATNFDTNQAVQLYKNNERYKNANFGKIPMYETFDSESEIEYVEIGCLTGSDPVKIYKKYEDINGDVLENGDKVQVKIIIKANQSFTGTFIDRISGPRKIPTTGDVDMIENFWFTSGTISPEKVENELLFHRDLNKGWYMMDNLSMNAGDEIEINYRLYYDGDIKTQKIELQDVDGNQYPKFAGNTGEKLSDYPKDSLLDIKIKSIDTCNKSMFVLFNENNIAQSKKSYMIEYIDLSQILMDFYSTSQTNYENAMSSIINTLTDNNGGQDINLDGIPGLGNMVESINISDIWSDSFSVQGGFDLTNIANLPSNILDGLMGDVMGKVDKIMSDMCKGFELSDYGLGGEGSCGLPVPFNQAFLGPGNYHLFGCFDLDFLTETIGKGIPTLTIPGNWPNPFGGGYLPIPGIFGLPFKGSTDGFLGIDGGSRSSQFRLYLVPTLTAELGIAMCFGPYDVGTAIPDPASSIGGNCIVTAVPLCGDTGGGSGGPNQTNQIPDALLDLEPCNNQNIPCHIGPGESNSSLKLVSSSSSSINMTTAIPDGSFAGGFINIEKTPITQQGYHTPESGVFVDGVKLFGGASTQNKIVGSDSQGLIEKVVKGWMDKQINYIFNNLTNFKIDISWPDFGGIVSGIPELFSTTDEEQKNKCREQKGEWIQEEGKPGECRISDQQRCINRGMARKSATESCEKKANPKQNEEALNNIDAWAQSNLLSREQITNLSETAFANPFDKMVAMFEEVPLINLRTENITVTVPMISSEDITSYVSMSKNWIAQQEKILEEWMNLFKAMIGWCGGRQDIKNLKELGEATKELKEQLRNEQKELMKSSEKEIKNLEEKIEQEQDPDQKKILENQLKETKDTRDNAKKTIDAIDKKIKHIKDLSKDYDLSDLGIYDIYESCDVGKYYIKANSDADYETIIPNDIYILYDPSIKNKNDKLKMFTKGWDLVNNNGKISYIRNSNEAFSNEGLCIKTYLVSKNNQCADLFLGGEFDVTLNTFLNIQSNTTQLINSVKQNIETLQMYKKFPIDLYERMHVGDRYMAEISSIINSFLGTLSLWMKTNATRYSQYVDALILTMTTIQTYQAIIDLSVNWSERCSTCTNDNYDQFACKLGLLCPDPAAVLPVFEIPPMKIPSIYMDFSNINLGTDIKLPKFNFVPTSVPLPSLPNIPSPPKINISLDMEAAISMGIDLIGDLVNQLNLVNQNISMPAIPIIPEPPNLPQLPSFIPSVNMELPLLPPAPKIPKLPNEIKAAIDLGETIGRILCIVKGNIGLVGEDSIKAKIEQMTQRKYEVPYRDNIDQTLAEWNQNAKTKIPQWITNIFGFLKSNEFEKVELKGFDILVESRVNLQYNFDGFYDFINAIVGQVNQYSAIPQDLMQRGVDVMDAQARELERRMSACVSNPVSELCLGTKGVWFEQMTNHKLDNSNPGDYQKLEKIMSYTQIETKFEKISESIEGIIKISSNIELGKVKIYIKSTGDNLISIINVSNNITEGKNNYKIGEIVIEPFDNELLNFKLGNPVKGTNTIEFYLCLPDTQNIDNCVKRTTNLKIEDTGVGNIMLTQEKLNEKENEIKSIGNNIQNGFAGVKEAIQKTSNKQKEFDSKKEFIDTLMDDINELDIKLEILEGDLKISTNTERINTLNQEISETKTKKLSNIKNLEKANNEIELIKHDLDVLNSKYGSSVTAYDEYLDTYQLLLDLYYQLKEKLDKLVGDALDGISETIKKANDFANEVVTSEKIQEWNEKMQSKMDEFDQKQMNEKTIRQENIRNLYKEINPEDFDKISYVDYDQDTYKESTDILKDTLNTILVKSDDPKLNKQVESYISLMEMDKEIKADVGALIDIEKKYTSIVNNIIQDNKNMGDLIVKDYDKFLLAIEKNNVSLVNQDEIEFSLSSKLFDLNTNVLENIKDKESLGKMYLDYYSKNVDGYLSAMQNYSASELNMDENEYNIQKIYLEDLNQKTKLAYGLLDDKLLITQNNTPGSSNNNGANYVDISSYINVLKTPEGSINLANKDYVKSFQNKILMVDLNKDGENDLIMWDQNNVYVKYRDSNRVYNNINYNNKYYKYSIKSYDKLLKDSNEGFVKINDIHMKICDRNREVKNFKYTGGDFDSVKISWLNSRKLGDEPIGYLVKMIHRVDLFDDKEIIVSNNNRELFDKKYVLVLPKGSPITGTKIGIEEGLFETESLLSGIIFDVMYYNENQDIINLTIVDIPRNWQYSKIYTLNLYQNEFYLISSPSSNQIVAGPQLIGDTQGPIPDITLYRPSIDTVIDTGTRFDGYVSTNYTIRAKWEDNVAIEKLWISDINGNIIKEQNDIKQKTGYIELDNLFFTGVGIKNYYFVGLDTNGNTESTQVTLSIKKPNIEIIDMQKYGNIMTNINSPTTITAKIDHDMDEGFVQFLRNRNGIWQVITGTMGGVEIDKYALNPLQTIVTGGYYDFGNDIGLYLSNGDLAVKINPENGKIEIVDGFENLVKIDVDYTMRTPMLKISQIDGTILFWVALSSKELVNIDSSLDIRELKGDIFGDFNGGKAIIENDEVLIYVSPKGQIYVDTVLYGDYKFDDNKGTVIYGFRKNINGQKLGSVEVKVKNLLGE